MIRICILLVFERLSAYLRIFASFFSPPPSPRGCAHVHLCLTVFERLSAYLRVFAAFFPHLRLPRATWLCAHVHLWLTVFERLSANCAFLPRFCSLPPSPRHVQCSAASEWRDSWRMRVSATSSPSSRASRQRWPHGWRVSVLYLFSVFWIRIHWVRIRIQHFRLNTHLDPDPGFLWPKKLKKFISGKNLIFFFDQKLQFTYP